MPRPFDEILPQLEAGGLWRAQTVVGRAQARWRRCGRRRDPRDVAISYEHHAENMHFDHFLELRAAAVATTSSHRGLIVVSSTDRYPHAGENGMKPLAIAVLMCGVLSAGPVAAAGHSVVGWNNLGMHCMDADFSVLSLLPPYNTIHAQVMDPTGRLIDDPTAAGIVVTYEAIADAAGSINTTSQGKTNFWAWVERLFGAAPVADHGLAGAAMPGPGNVPQPMTWDPVARWFVAPGIPITPYDDAGRKNPYPMMRIVARTTGGVMLAWTDIVLPVSDEMDCTTCHTPAAGTPAPAMPAGGWIADADPQRALRLNILAKHDELEAGAPAFTAALAALAPRGYSPAGLLSTVADGTPILCANCHASEALGTGGQPNVQPLTQAMHGGHAGVTDPLNGLTLDSAADRSACYRCHPGSETRCLRGAMGAAVAADGTLAIQCQGCHGGMSTVASPMRTGWLDEPTCQSCHTGTAVQNSGQIRFTSVFDAPDHVRQPANARFATTPDAPLPGLSLYRFSTGHGGLACEACHGSTHAEFPSTHANDNVQSTRLQGHAGTLVECGSCHGGVQPTTVSGGPHGMHPVGQVWVSGHHEAIGENGDTSACRDCHGADYRGTVLSRAKASRTLSGEAATNRCGRDFRSAATPVIAARRTTTRIPTAPRSRPARPSRRRPACRSTCC